MLNPKSIQLKNNLIVVDEHPVEVSETAGGVMRPKEDIEKERRSRTIRTGTIKLVGHIDDEVLEKLTTSSTKGKLDQLIGKTILYGVHAIEQPLDIPIEGIERPILMNISYIFAFLEDEQIDS
jgi:hypothetical protein